jgi:hypothetical protein
MKRVILILLIVSSHLSSCTARKRERVEAVPSPTVTLDSAPRNTRSGAASVAEEKATKLAIGAATRLLGSLKEYDVKTSWVDNGWLVTVQSKKISSSPGTISGGVIEYFMNKDGEIIKDVKIYQ